MTNPTTIELIQGLNLIEHPEGGYFVETDRQQEVVPTPFAGGAPRPLSTSIFYLLSYDRPDGVIHMNKSVTYHVLHHGRAEYTLVTPGNPPNVEKKVMGTDSTAGETRMLFVGSGVWKLSKIPSEDFDRAKTQDERDRTNCLITEVVVPGFHWEDHKYLTVDELKQLFGTSERGEKYVEELIASVKKQN